MDKIEYLRYTSTNFSDLKSYLDMHEEKEFK